MSSWFERDRSSHFGNPCDRKYIDPLFSDVDFPTSNTLPNRKSRNKFSTDTRPSCAGRRHFAENTRSFSPSARRSGEDILLKLKDNLRRDSGMFSKSPDLNSTEFGPRRADDSEDWTKNFDEMRSRQPIFRMPNWMSDDEDMSSLTSRMSQAPHFATMGGRIMNRGGPWRERRHSGGSAMSGTSEDDSVDSSHRQDPPPPVSIPIRIEAEAPPGMMPTHSPYGLGDRATNVELEAQSICPVSQSNLQQPVEPHLMCVGQLRKQPHYASRTSPAVDAISQEEASRDTRCASAPPDMTDPISPHNKFISKTKIAPQTSNEKVPFNNSPVFNNVPKPFISSNPLQTNTLPTKEEKTSNCQSFINVEQQPNIIDQHQQIPEENIQQQQPSEQQRGGHKSSIVRNIPIIVEGRDKDFAKKERTPPPKQQQTDHQQKQSQWDQSTQNQQQRQSNWDQPKQNQQKQSQWDHPSQNQQQHAGQSHLDHEPGKPSWDHFQRSEWNHPFGSPSSYGFQADPFFEFPQSQRSKFQHHQQNQRQQPPQRQPSPPSQVQHQSSPSKQSHSQESPLKQTEHVEQSQPQPQTPVGPPKDIKMDKIIAIGNSIEQYFDRAKTFQGKKTDKEYLFLDEMLTRALIQLDNIDPDGCDDIRQARRTLIKGINDTLMNIEKIASEKPPEATFEAENQVSDMNRRIGEETIEPSVKISAGVSDTGGDLENEKETSENSHPKDFHMNENHLSEDVAENQTKL